VTGNPDHLSALKPCPLPLLAPSWLFSTGRFLI
jgi:hypothetical protein